ncbi:MAG: hypothetical protein GF317_14925 [Candidatus Lokiarchaeota archaeon]|nr:hypothetical protein [Candidatus Lokiarchaeota archaeon]MBD3200885.1 hypothetical protein [Candidatus Lokiarchaeota archaeon]
MSEKLYWNHPYQKDFEAKIIDIDEQGIVLDRTAFHPEGGGQLSDRGKISYKEEKFNVINVFKEKDQIIHQLEGKFQDKFNVGNSVNGIIDWDWRYGLMKAHTSQHLFSATLKKFCKVNTDKAYIGFEDVTIEFHSKISYDQLKNVLKAVNQIFSLKNISISTKIIDKSQIANYKNKIRGDIQLKDTIRLVISENYDMVCCGGTHLKNSTEIGMIFVYEFKSGNKIKYYLGSKALAKIAEVNLDLIESMDLVNQPIFDLKRVINDHSQKIENLEIENQSLSEEILRSLSKNPIEKMGEIKVFLLNSKLDDKLIQQSFNTFPKKSLLFIKSEKNIMIFSNSKMISARSLIKTFLDKYGGKGGGSDFKAQALLDKPPENILNYLNELLSKD